MTDAQFSLRKLCSVRMVHSRICVQLNRTQSVVHNRRGVRLVGAQLMYPRVACPIDMLHSYSRSRSARAPPCPVGCAESIPCTVASCSIDTIPIFPHHSDFLWFFFNLSEIIIEFENEKIWGNFWGIMKNIFTRFSQIVLNHSKFLIQCEMYKVQKFK